MKTIGLRLSLAAVCAFAGASQIGTTAQERPLLFTISNDETVTSVTVGHDFNGCAGSEPRV
jgi:hypothetical protein